MKEKLIEFFQNKKELIVFIGLLSITFLAVVLVANSTLEQDRDVVDTPNTDQDSDDDNDVVVPNPDLETPVYSFILPVDENKIVVRDFYNIETPGENDNAIIETNGMYFQSKGVSYANEDNSSFDVITIHPGTVTSVIADDVLGTTVTIDHGDNLYSVYSSLATTTVSEGDVVSENQVIATAGTSTYDIKAGVHVHVEIMSIENNKTTYINIDDIVGKTIDDIASSIK